MRANNSTLEQFSELGSGFNIAMKGRILRGAGDLLSGEQSGFINSGFLILIKKIMNRLLMS
jgi:transcription-repair coupling factor (superfamily II helicase)